MEISVSCRSCHQKRGIGSCGNVATVGVIDVKVAHLKAIVHRFKDRLVKDNTHIFAGSATDDIWSVKYFFPRSDKPFGVGVHILFIRHKSAREVTRRGASVEKWSKVDIGVAQTWIFWVDKPAHNHGVRGVFVYDIQNFSDAFLIGVEVDGVSSWG